MSHIKTVIRRKYQISGTSEATDPVWIDLDADNLADFAAFGKKGRHVAVKARLDATANNATAATLFIAEGVTLEATPADDDVFYESVSTSFTGHATTADLAENIAKTGGGHYCVARDSAMTIGLLVTPDGNGAFTFHVTLTSEVWH